MEYLIIVAGSLFFLICIAWQLLPIINKPPEQKPKPEKNKPDNAISKNLDSAQMSGLALYSNNIIQSSTVKETSTKEKVFLFKSISQGQENEQECILENTKTRKVHRFKYRAPVIYKRTRYYKIESDWTGSAEELMERLIPQLENIHFSLNPIKEEFTSKPDSSEFSHGEKEYCEQFQTSEYKCTIDIGPRLLIDVSFKFKNSMLKGHSIHGVDRACSQIRDESEHLDFMHKLDLMLRNVNGLIYSLRS